MFWGIVSSIRRPFTRKINLSKIKLYLTHSRSRRLTVRTPGSHPGNRSSILREITNMNLSERRNSEGLSFEPMPYVSVCTATELSTIILRPGTPTLLSTRITARCKMWCSAM